MVLPGYDLDEDGIDAWFDVSGKLYAWSGTEGSKHWIYWNKLARFVFDNQATFVTAYALPSAGHDLINEIYFHSILPLALHARGFEVLHASAVQAPGGVIAFCAASGVGKSSTAYALHRRGYSVWADDAVAFQMLDGSPLSVPVPFDLRLFPDQLTALKGQSFTTSARGAPERAAHPGPQSQPLRAICLLNRQNSLETELNIRLETLSQRAAFSELMPHAYTFERRNPTRTRKMLMNYLDLVSGVPIYRISYLSSLELLAGLLDEIENRIIPASG